MRAIIFGIVVLAASSACADDVADAIRAQTRALERASFDRQMDADWDHWQADQARLDRLDVLDRCDDRLLRRSRYPSYRYPRYRYRGYGGYGGYYMLPSQRTWYGGYSVNIGF